MKQHDNGISVLLHVIRLKRSNNILPLPLQTCLKSSVCRQPVLQCCCCPTRTERRCVRCCACWATWRPVWPRTRWLPPTWLSAWPHPSSTLTTCVGRRARRQGVSESVTVTVPDTVDYENRKRSLKKTQEQDAEKGRRQRLIEGGRERDRGSRKVA